ncbi:MAG: hypothetical protein WCA78_01245 [Rhizomicrobium sp.]
MATNAGAELSELDRFRAAVLSDVALQEALHTYDDQEGFVARALEIAGQHGINLIARDLEPALRYDPLGLARWTGGSITASSPQIGWLPIHITLLHGQSCVDWAYFGQRQLTEPFFEDSIRGVLRKPINRLARYRTFLGDLPTWAEQHPGLQPSGFIFHMSRCGSTLVSQMLAADPRNIVISEASPIDAIARLDPSAFGLDDSKHAALLKATIGALGQRRAHHQTRHFIKLDSWHTLSLPLFRRAFPSVPWIFLYREPSEVLASQLRQRGIQTVPEYLSPIMFGLKPEDSLPPDVYCARLLNRICEAALQPLSEGGGLPVNYTQLPQALWTMIMPHFDIECSDRDREIMLEKARYDSKMPTIEFSTDGDDRRQTIMASARPIAERYIGAAYRRLEVLRLGKPANREITTDESGSCDADSATS